MREAISDPARLDPACRSRRRMRFIEPQPARPRPSLAHASSAEPDSKSSQRTARYIERRHARLSRASTSLAAAPEKDVDGRVKLGHDGKRLIFELLGKA
jgi:hypothetical protein